MPIFMDVHGSLGDATQDDIRAAHQKDLEMQDQFGVRWLTWWFDDGKGKSFCLVEAPDADTAVACHKASHGLAPHEIIEVSGDAMAGFFGDWAKDSHDQAVFPEKGHSPDTALRAIMFTDIVGSTSLSTRLGDAAAVRAVETHDSVVRACLERFEGREVKHTGDGILASFVSISHAVDAAIDMQRELATLRSAQRDDAIEISIGISAGEPVNKHDDLYGASVNLAARLCAHAESNQIVVSSAVKDLALGKPYQFAPVGSIALKGFDEAVHAYEVEH
ncbi:MAG: DUF4242 domain-containing protein [Acidimicrobiia bacterium]|nr:DUF4242 domain-containing protein [Acidimicrobiia bacterium]